MVEARRTRNRGRKCWFGRRMERFRVQLAGIMGVRGVGRGAWSLERGVVRRVRQGVLAAPWPSQCISIFNDALPPGENLTIDLCQEMAG